MADSPRQGIRSRARIRATRHSNAARSCGSRARISAPVPRRLRCTLLVERPSVAPPAEMAGEEPLDRLEELDVVAPVEAPVPLVGEHHVFDVLARPPERLDHL